MRRPEPRAAEEQERGGALTPFAAPRAAPADTRWLPATSLALRGRAFNDTPTAFNRLPAAAHGVVRDAVWGLSLNSPGLVVGFATDSASIYVDYTAQDGFGPMVHFPVSGVSGLELFSFDEAAGAFRHVQPLQLSFGVNSYSGAVATGVLPLAGGRPRRYKLFLPLYNNPTNLSIGVDSTAATFVPDEPFAHATNPVVWYGTSIAQGGVSFKAANAFTNVIATALDLEIFNFGFSGNCKLEVDVAQFLTTIANPGAILVDCMRNEDAAGVNSSASEAMWAGTFVCAPPAPAPARSMLTSTCPHPYFAPPAHRPSPPRLCPQSRSCSTCASSTRLRRSCLSRAPALAVTGRLRRARPTRPPRTARCARPLTRSSRRATPTCIT